jgi:hypothetical protein
MNQVHTDEMVLGTVSREAGLHERQPKACRAKLSTGGPPGSSPPRSDGSCGGQAGGWTAATVTKDAQRSWKTTLGSQTT